MLAKVIILTGPTASGKTDLLHQIAQKSDIIINADSQQFYKKLDIGSAKPSPEELEKFNYQLVDFLEPGESISAYQFLEKTLDLIKKAKKNSSQSALKEPLRIFLVGGSLFYLDAIKNGLPPTPQIKPGLKSKLAHQLAQKGLDYMGNIIKEKDPEFFQEVDLKNPHRVLRALEIIESGFSFSLLRKQRTPPPLEILQIAPIFPRHILYSRIEQRVEEMFKKGWIDEVKQLLNEYTWEDISKVKTIGYAEIIEYLQGKKDYKTTIEVIKQKTRQMAKRQITWLKKKNDGFFLFSGYNKINNDGKNNLDDWIKQRLNSSNQTEKNQWIITEDLVASTDRLIDNFYQ